MSIQELPVQAQPVEEPPVQAQPVQEPPVQAQPSRTASSRNCTGHPGPTAPTSSPRRLARDAEGLSVWPRSARPEPHGDVSVGGVLTEAADRSGTPLTSSTNRKSASAAAPTAPRSPTPTSSTPPSISVRAMAHWIRKKAGPGRLLRRRTRTRRHHRLPARENRAPRQRQKPRGPQHRPAPRRRPHRRGQHLRYYPPRRPHAPRHPPARHGPRDTRHRRRRTHQNTHRHRRPEVRPSLTDGSAQHAVTRILDQPHQLVGLHCHIGSQVTTVKPYVAAVRRMTGLLARIRDQHGIALPQLNIGGGHAIAYRPGEEHLQHLRPGRTRPRRTGRRLRPRPPAPPPPHRRTRPRHRRPRRRRRLPGPGRPNAPAPTPSSPSTAA